MKLVKCRDCKNEYEKKLKECPKCGRPKDKNMFAFFVVMLILFLVVFFASQILTGLVTESAFTYKFGYLFVGEALWALIILIVMLLCGNSYVFTQKREKFWKSIKFGLPMLLLSLMFFLSSVFSLDEFNLFNCINLIMYCLAIGVVEEFLCRGWLQNEFIERFGNSRKQVIISILLSSIIFGVIHIVNIIGGQDVFVTVMQVFQATAAGILLGSIYYRTKNIWAVIFLHGFYDFSLFLSELNTIKDCTTGVASTSIIIYEIFSSMLIVLFWIISAVLILRKSKLNKMFNKDYKLTIEEQRVDKRKTIFLYGCLGVLFIVFMLPINVSGYDDYHICYSYNEIEFEEYDTHYPYYDKFEINYTRIKDDYNFDVYYDNDVNGLKIENVNTGYYVILDYDSIYEYEVIENKETFLIVIHVVDGIESKIYYTSVEKDLISNSMDFLEEIMDSFKEYSVPEISQIGYLTVVGSDYVYPLMLSELYDKFIIDENGELYLLRQ